MKEIGEFFFTLFMAGATIYIMVELMAGTVHF